jgi:uncharacterized protein (TIGR02217 family)
MALSITQDSLPIFPTDLGFGRPGGPEYNTDVAILESGHEQRNIYWQEPRYSWDVGYGVREMDKIYAMLEFFHSCKGRARPFRFKDWLDYKSCDIDAVPAFDDQSLGDAVNGQTQFQLKKVYAKSPYSTTVDIIKPRGASILIGEDGTAATSGWTIDETTGIITRDSALSGGEKITWGGEFYRKARFDVDKLSHSFVAWEAGEVDVPVISLRGV